MHESPMAQFQEVDVVTDIAVRDALALSQNPCMVHVLGALLYRVRDADPGFAARVGIDFIAVREWATQNLPLISSDYKPYEGPLDFEYTFNLYEEKGHHRVNVRRVHRPVRTRAAEQTPQDMHKDSVQGVGIFRVATEDSPPATGIRMVIVSLDEVAKPNEGPPEPTIVSLQRLLPRILEDQQVLACLADHGLDPGTLVSAWPA